MTSGYSKTPLHKKLGLAEGQSVLLINIPKSYSTLIGPVYKNLFEKKLEDKDKVDFIHCFFTSREDLSLHIEPLKKRLNPKGALWISWPKKVSKLSTDLTRDVIREYILTTGLVDIKVASIDDTWSGLKFVIRKKDR